MDNTMQPPEPANGQLADWPWLDAYTGPTLRFTVPTARWTAQQFSRVIAPNGAVLYRLWDASRALLYVGMSRSPAYRWGKHRILKSWWSDVAIIGYAAYDTEWLAQRAEKIAIAIERPLHNIMLAVN